MVSSVGSCGRGDGAQEQGCSAGVRALGVVGSLFIGGVALGLGLTGRGSKTVSYASAGASLVSAVALGLVGRKSGAAAEPIVFRPITESVEEIIAALPGKTLLDMREYEPDDADFAPLVRALAEKKCAVELVRWGEYGPDLSEVWTDIEPATKRYLAKMADYNDGIPWLAEEVIPLMPQLRSFFIWPLADQEDATVAALMNCLHLEYIDDDEVATKFHQEMAKAGGAGQEHYLAQLTKFDYRNWQEVPPSQLAQLVEKMTGVEEFELYSVHIDETWIPVFEALAGRTVSFAGQYEVVEAAKRGGSLSPLQVAQLKCIVEVHLSSNEGAVKLLPLLPSLRKVQLWEEPSEEVAQMLLDRANLEEVGWPYAKHVFSQSGTDSPVYHLAYKWATSVDVCGDEVDLDFPRGVPCLARLELEPVFPVSS